MRVIWVAMPATDPFTYNVPKKVSDSELARTLRLDAMAEFDAINLYSAHMASTENEDARKVLAFVRGRERAFRPLCRAHPVS